MPNPLVPAGLIGVATGLRSQIGFATVLATTPQSSLPSAIQNPVTKPLAVGLALGELIWDKYPAVPPRTAPLGLVPRLGLGAASAALLAKRTGEPIRVPAIAGLVAASVVTFASLRVRSLLDDRLTPILSAILEDASAAAFAGAAAFLAPATANGPPDILPSAGHPSA